MSESEKYVFDVKLASGEVVSVPGVSAIIGPFKDLCITEPSESNKFSNNGVAVFLAGTWILAVRRQYELKIAEPTSNDDVPPEFKE